MLDELCKNFIISGNADVATNVIHYCIVKGYNQLGATLGKFFCQYFPPTKKLYNETAVCCYHIKDYKTCHELHQRLLACNLTEKYAQEILFNDHFCTNHTENDYVGYNKEIVEQIVRRPRRSIPKLTFTITTCKRLDLFVLTMNSFINCCKDLDMIDHWICIDDNSSEEDREKMNELYPFFQFYWKTAEEKGHPQSMNILRKLISTPYFFHMEDDWKYVSKENYMTILLDILTDNQTIGQALVNRNYAEIAKDVSIPGGLIHTTTTGTRYYHHEYCATKADQLAFNVKYKSGMSCSYWPHYSFRPSMTRMKIWHELGEFDTTVNHFEMDYSYRYIKAGYISAFMEGIYCLHTGRLTSQKNDPTIANAYTLNDEAQFSGKEDQAKKQKDVIKEVNDTVVSSNVMHIPDIDIKIKTIVVNLDRRPDRWEAFKQQQNAHWMNYERYSAVDGEKLLPNEQLQRIFDNNDYNMRKGMVGCAMSHIDLCIQLLKSEYDAYCILEDDLEFVPEFQTKFKYVYSQLPKDWDMVYLGHHLWKKHRTPTCYDKDAMPLVTRWGVAESLGKSMGGTGGYVISKVGARKLLEFISRTGMTNGIDTVQQKSADELAIYYCNPHLIYSECFMGDNKPDTDIQHNFESLATPMSERFASEIEFYGEDDQVFLATFEHALEYVQNKEKTKIAFYRSINIPEIAKVCIHPHYTMDDKILVIVPKPTERHFNGRYFDRLKKNGQYDISDALCTK